ncbi:hypothetical protein EJ06DRAFT_531897 [Trichodelitschia bisporula]|uniref:Protection of telomeres protein 1 n=1 Tax=Trichodelitschia bisporula TaxID=703511 RepID=A0A6G1HSK9_9PEZI|nr:hypothetical protein EJ06DRAFT_531897 [Trichodelitschia bisporula]
MAAPLPPGYTDLKVAEQSNGKEINIIGIVVDVRPPARTRGDDHQMTLSLQDPARMETGQAVGFTCKMFGQVKDFPTQATIGDILMLRRVKNMPFRGEPTLLNNRNSEFLLFLKSYMPKVPFEIAYQVHKQIQHIARSGRPKVILKPAEQAYIIHLHRWSVQNMNMPVVEVGRPTNIAEPLGKPRDKFSLVKDIRDGTFVDLLCEVRKIYNGSNALELYATDYTSNNHLYDYRPLGEEGPDSREGDQFGYTRTKTPSVWPGPYGKFAIQVTLWSPHMQWAAEHVKVGDIISLRNVHIRYKDSKLEGSMHTDKQHSEQVDVRKPMKDQRYYDLLDRRSKHVEEVAAQAESNAQNQGKKSRRKKKKNKQDQAEAASKQNTRANTPLQPAAQTTSAAEPVASKNETVVCSHPDQDLVRISDILNDQSLQWKDRSGDELTLPFINRKFKTSVRAVDFFPPALEDFCQSTQDLRYNDFQPTTDDDTGDDSFQSLPEWEWAFYLLVEDAKPVPGQTPERMRLLVADRDAEGLLGLDATDLRKSPETLAQLKEKLFCLWGELEEKKAEPDFSPGTPISNRPFECLVYEYGAHTPGKGVNDWTRVHRMWGVTIR